ncbi:hypothetical protein I8Y06_001676 [Photobacterium damselae]|nr:hypothetical protein [Photobacterium damselae]
MNSVSDNFYKNHIVSNTNMTPMMPLVHVCDCHRLRNILVSNAIIPTKCPVFEEDLAYFFYGRPSYRIGDGGFSSNTPSLFPVCFILDSAYITDIKRVFPFDTGAFAAGLYKKYIHSKATFSDYIFEPTYDFIRRYVDMFYSSNENYFNGEATIVKGLIPTMAFELQSLHQMITSTSTEEVDDRCYTVEIQSFSGVDISGGAVMAMVLPVTIMDDPIVSSYLFDNNIEPITYETSRCAPSSLTPLIIDKVRSYYLNEGVI